MKYNFAYIRRLIRTNRSGLLIKLIKDNIHDWSLKNYENIFYIITQNSHIMSYFIIHFKNIYRVPEQSIIHNQDTLIGLIAEECDHTIYKLIFNNKNYEYNFFRAYISQYIFIVQMKYLLSNEIQIKFVIPLLYVMFWHPKVKYNKIKYFFNSSRCINLYFYNNPELTYFHMFDKNVMTRKDISDFANTSYIKFLLTNKN